MVHGLLRKGVKRDHFDLVGEGLKQIKGWFEEQRITEELREELMSDPDAQVAVHPSGAWVARAGVDQATIDAALAAVAPAPAPASVEDFDDEAALALVAAAEEAEAAKTKEADDVIDWDAVGAAADAARAEHDAKRARVL